MVDVADQLLVGWGAEALVEADAVFGFAAAAASLIEVVRMSVYVPRNARALMADMRLGGEVKGLSHGEVAARAADYTPYSVQTWRAWEYWSNRAGCGHLAGERPVEAARTSHQA